MERFSQLSDVQLVDQILTWSGRIAAGEAELLAYIGEFDRREAWAGTGLLSVRPLAVMAHRPQPEAAREKVRVARALREPPQVQDAVAAGRCLTPRCALGPGWRRQRTRSAGSTPPAARPPVSWNGVVRGVRRACKVDQDAADPELAAWRMQATKSYDEDGNAGYRIVMPAEQSAVVDAGLEAMQAELGRRAAAASGSSFSTGRRHDQRRRFRGSEFSTARHAG